VGADSDIVSWGTDGIDQNALAAPKIVLDPTGRHLHFHGKRVKIKMQIVKEHWGRDAIYLCPPYMIKNANMVATVLTMQLLRLRGDPTRAHKRDIRIQADGGAENWNQTLIALAAFWVHMGICNSVQLNCMFPRHGHSDFDAKGAVITTHINGSQGEGKDPGMNIHTLPQMMEEVRAAAVRSKKVQSTGDTTFFDMQHSLDFTQFFEKHIHDQMEKTQHGHCQMTVDEIKSQSQRKASIMSWRVKADSDAVIRATFKLHSQDTDWLGTNKDGEMVPGAPGCRVLKSLPSATEYPALAPVYTFAKWGKDAIQANVMRNIKEDTANFTEAHRAGMCTCHKNLRMPAFG